MKNKKESNIGNLLMFFLKGLTSLIPIIIIMVIWINMDTSYKNNEISTLLFTVLIFILIPLIDFVKKFKLVYIILSIILYAFLVAHKNIVFLYINDKLVSNAFYMIIYLLFTYSVLMFLYLIIEDSYSFKKFCNIIKKFFNIEKIKNRINYEFIEATKLNIRMKEDKKDDWSTLAKFFTKYRKKGSTSLLKKNKLLKKFKFEAKENSMEEVFKLRHYEEVFNSLHDVLLDTEIKDDSTKEEKDEFNKEKKTLAKLLSEAIFSIKFLHYKIGLNRVLNTIRKILGHMTSLLFITISVSLIFYFIKNGNRFDNFIDLIEYEDLLKFVLGLFILIISIPIGYGYFLFIKLISLQEYTTSSHDNPIVVLKNLFYYLLTFIFMILTLTFSLFVLSHSGIEYNHAFHFLSTLILPTMELSDLPSILTAGLGSDIVFSMISIKIFVLLFIFATGSLIIRHLMEIYRKLYDKLPSNDGYTVPPEFSSFFAYLMLSVFSIVLLYGTIFINYPNLNNEYKQCNSYLIANPKTLENCSKQNNSTLKEVKDYCDDIKKQKEIKFEDRETLPLKNCSIGMSIEINKDKRLSNESISAPNRSLSDYLPLSIFLTLFGVVMMIATKNLLENYFTGLSLKINTPFEEGERIRIDNGEMLSVLDIGFRATSFYGISSHANLVIPHQQLTNSVITNYTQPTLDYREKITIFIPDRHIGDSLPREAEKILLLAAFLSTGVKKPRLAGSKYFKDFVVKFGNISTEEIKLNSRKGVNEELEKLENQVNELWNELMKVIDKIKTNNKELDVKQSLFIDKIVELIPSDNKDETKKEESEKEKTYKVIKKIISSIISVTYDYEDTLDTKLVYSIDEYYMKRKNNILNVYKNKNSKNELNIIANYLVNINYYYFSLAKQLWRLKDKDSHEENNVIDEASLEILDVPRVTSTHKRDIEGAFWEVSLLVTVELAEQSDEIVQHINMYVDDLWEIFGLPVRCNDKKK